MCLGGGGGGLKPVSTAGAPDTSNWTPQQIQEFLIKYPTMQKASSLPPGVRLTTGYDPAAVWSQVAGSSTGREFLTVHAQNRRAAGDNAEADNISAFLKSTDGTTLNRLPTLPPPAPSSSASTAVRADVPNQITNNRAGTNALLIPLNNPNRLPTIQT